MRENNIAREGSVELAPDELLNVFCTLDNFTVRDGWARVECLRCGRIVRYSMECWESTCQRLDSRQLLFCAMCDPDKVDPAPTSEQLP